MQMTAEQFRGMVQELLDVYISGIQTDRQIEGQKGAANRTLLAIYDYHTGTFLPHLKTEINLLPIEFVEPVAESETSTETINNGYSSEPNEAHTRWAPLSAA